MASAAPGWRRRRRRGRQVAQGPNVDELQLRGVEHRPPGLGTPIRPSACSSWAMENASTDPASAASAPRAAHS